jgi:hypothetical protein
VVPRLRDEGGGLRGFGLFWGLVGWLFRFVLRGFDLRLGALIAVCSKKVNNYFYFFRR